MTKIKINLDDPETRAVWDAALEAKREVASWPAWKRGEETRMGYAFDDEDRTTALQLFAEIQLISENGPYHPGVTRPSYSTIETRTLRRLQQFAFSRHVGLLTWTDTAGNAFFSSSETKTGPCIMIGSHVDSVPQGGNYDGLAGVVAGLLVLQKIQQRGLQLPVRLVALRGEESAWFGVPYIGAKGLLGKLAPADLERRFNTQGSPAGEPLAHHMAECGANVGLMSAGVPYIDPSLITEFWELHIEQGPVLVNENKPVGVVTGIRGNVRHARIRIEGEEGHSGTVPHEMRHDAVFAFAEFIMRLDASWYAVRQFDQDLVVTSGIVKTDPTVHAITRIPGSIEFCLEWRSQSTQTLDMFNATVQQAARLVEERCGVKFVFDEAVQTEPAKLDAGHVNRALAACLNLDLPPFTLPSGAGHDAAVFANAGISTGMIFVRNANGSHNPNEAMDIDDFMKGVEVLYKVVTAKAP